MPTWREGAGRQGGRTFLATALAALALAGCSSGQGSSSPTTAAPGTTAPAATSAPAPGSDDPFCNFIRTYNERFGRINPGATADPQQFRTVLTDSANALKEAAASAPAAIRPDVTVMSQAMQQLVDAFRQVNFDATRINVAALASLQAPEFIAAGQRIDDYTRQNCV